MTSIMMKSRGKAKWALVSAIAVAALTLAGCGGSDSSDSAADSSADAPAELTPVTSQLGWLKLTQFGGFFIADANGYYGEEGLAVTFDAGGPNISAWQSVSSGRAQVGDDDNTNVLVAISKGEPLVIIGAIFQTSPFAIISLSSNPINSIEDVRGKTIALPEQAKAQVEALIEAAGIPLSEVELVPAGPDPSALASGQVDGYFGYATAQAVALQAQGLEVETLYLEDLGVPSYGNVIITTKDQIENNKDLLVRYMRGSIMGYEWLNANPEKGAQIVVSDYGPPELVLENEQLTAAFQKDLISTPSGVLVVDPAKMQQIIDSLVEVGTLEGPLNAADVVNTSILEEAYAGSTSLLK
jgi:NitT/TauT family transport system substrate-binding protein